MFCHGTQTMDNSRICHCLLFHEHGKQKLHGAISLVKKASYYATHAWTNFSPMKSWAENLALTSVIVCGGNILVRLLLFHLLQFRLLLFRLLNIFTYFNSICSIVIKFWFTKVLHAFVEVLGVFLQGTSTDIDCNLRQVATIKMCSGKKRKD